MCPTQNRSVPIVLAGILLPNAAMIHVPYHGSGKTLPTNLLSDVGACFASDHLELTACFSKCSRGIQASLLRCLLVIAFAKSGYKASHNSITSNRSYLIRDTANAYTLLGHHTEKKHVFRTRISQSSPSSTPKRHSTTLKCKSKYTTPSTSLRNLQNSNPPSIP
jgi:hypothetical protein